MIALKRGVTGPYCDQCLPKHFNLIEDVKHKKGCLTCFCNGLDVDCESSSQLFYNKIKTNFEAEYQDWFITNKFTKFNESVLLDGNSIVFNRFDEFKNEELFFIVPSKFKGDKVGNFFLV